jgi:hypothetical protein
VQNPFARRRSSVDSAGTRLPHPLSRRTNTTRQTGLGYLATPMFTEDNQTLNDNDETSPYEEDGYESSWSLEGQCQACDTWGRVDDLGLCDDCAPKLERDLIRQREWDYSAMAFGVSPDDREKLRQQVIAQFGAALELIAPSKEHPPRRRRKRRKTTRPKRRGV